MTPTERIERAARHMAEYDGEDVNCWRGYADDVARILTAAFPELMSAPPTAWIAPMEATEGMLWHAMNADIIVTVDDWGEHTVEERHADQAYRAMRDAHLKEQANDGP